MSLVKRSSGNHPLYSREVNDKVDDRGTPWDVFNELHAQYQFTIDVAASDINAKLPRYWTRDDNGLTKPWAGERVWCNPPFSDLWSWTVKAIREQNHAELIVMLVPANRCEQPWWQLIEERRDNGGRLSTRFLPGRPRFYDAGVPQEGKPKGRPPFGCCLLIWGPR